LLSELKLKGLNQKDVRWGRKEVTCELGRQTAQMSGWAILFFFVFFINKNILSFQILYFGFNPVVVSNLRSPSCACFVISAKNKNVVHALKKYKHKINRKIK